MTEETTTTETTTEQEKAASLLDGKSSEDTAKPEGQEAPKEEAPKEETPPEADVVTAETLKFPEEVNVDKEMVDTFLGVLNDKNLSRAELAQKLVDMQVKTVREASEMGSKAWQDLQESWQKEVKADQEVGGAKLQPTIEKIGKVLDRYGSDELRELFGTTGAGNNIHMVRFLAKIADDMAEGGPVTGTPGAPPKSAADILYGKE